MNEQNKMIPVCVYCDSTDLFTEDEIMQENLCDLDFPEYIVRAWYEAHKKELDETTAADLRIPLSECNFYIWFNEVSTAIDTDGLFDWAIKNYGFHAQRYNEQEDEQ